MVADRRREAEIQDRLLRVLEKIFARRIAKVTREHIAEMVEGLRDLGYVPPVSDAAEQAMREVYRDIAERSARTFGRRMIRLGKSMDYKADEPGFWTQLFRSIASAWVNQEAIRRRITSVTETTRSKIIAQVEIGQAAGFGIDKIAGQITKAAPSIARGRGALIARTETHGASNYAAYQSAQQTGLTLRKEWLATLDHRTREAEFDHAAMDGQTRDMDEPFEMPWTGGDPIKIMFPGESGHPGGATINCRCSVVYIPQR